MYIYIYIYLIIYIYIYIQIHEFLCLDWAAQQPISPMCAWGAGGQATVALAGACSEFRTPLKIHDQAAWKAGVRQGGPSRPKKVGQGLGLIEPKLPSGRLQWGKEALVGQRRWGCQTWPGSLGKDVLRDTWPAPWKAGEGDAKRPWQNLAARKAWEGGARVGPSRTKTAKLQFRNPWKIHDQAAWKAGVRQGGPSRPKKVGQGLNHQTAVSKPLLDTWPGSLEGGRRWCNRALVEPGSLEGSRKCGGWSGKRIGGARAGPSRTKTAKQQLRNPSKIHGQAARKAGVKQGGPSRPKKVGQGLGLVEPKLPNGSFETP